MTHKEREDQSLVTSAATAAEGRVLIGVATHAYMSVKCNRSGNL